MPSEAHSSEMLAPTALEWFFPVPHQSLYGEGAVFLCLSSAVES
jgi:hypothetical protein